MAKGFLDFEKLIKEVFIHILVLAIVGGLAKAVAEVLSVATPLLWSVGVAAAFIIASAVILYRKYRRFFKLRGAGVTGYYYTFEDAENKEVFSKCKRSFRYVGISGASFFRFFKEWQETRPDVTARLLLADPTSANLERQVGFREGVGLEEEPSLNLSGRINEAAETERKRIALGIAQIKGLDALKKGQVDVRLHDEFLPWWMYIIDDETIYLGILEKGKDGSKSPVIVITKIEGHPSPFDVFYNLWVVLWLKAKKTT